MTGVVDVGGGLRGIYGAGVFDYCLDNKIKFDYCIGVSAGSANIASYLGKQKQRNYKFYMEYTFRKQYMSLDCLLHKGSYLDLDYIYGELSKKGGENPLNYESIKNSPISMKVVALNAQTGETIYFDKSDMMQDNYNILKASSCIPVVCKPYSVNGVPCYDGGLADPVPIKKAFEDGCDKVVVILTKPQNYVRTQEKNTLLATKLIRHKYPKAADNLFLRYKKYNDGVALAKEYANQGKALIIAPDNCCGMKTLTKNKQFMNNMYHKGYTDATSLQNFVTQSNIPNK